MSDLPQDDNTPQQDDNEPTRDAIFSKTHPQLREALDEAGDFFTSGDAPQADPIFSKTHPALRAFIDSIPEEIRGEGWVGQNISAINDWVHSRDVADRASAHSEEYVKNVDAFKQGLIKMVQNDPTSVSVAQNLIAPTVSHLIPASLPIEQAKATYASLAVHMKNEVAEAAVRSMATRSLSLAQKMLDSPVGDILDADQKANLGAFMHAQAIARGADHQAQQLEMAKAGAQQDASNAHRYGEELVNQGTGEAQFPNGWAARMMADSTVAPEDKGAMMNMYGRLQMNGDSAESNGHVIRNALNQMDAGTLSSKDIWDAVGNGTDGLSMKDAQWLHGLLHSDTEDGKAERDAFRNAMNDAATKLMGQAGENGAAGRRNFNNYAKWLTGAYQKTGLAGLDPNQDGYLFKNVGTHSFNDPSPRVIVNGVTQDVAQAQPRHVSSYFRRAPTRRRR